MEHDASPVSSHEQPAMGKLAENRTTATDARNDLNVAMDASREGGYVMTTKVGKGNG